MTEQEISAIAVADKHRPFNEENTVFSKLQWLRDEIEELEEGFTNKDMVNVDEEIGDALYPYTYSLARKP